MRNIQVEQMKYKGERIKLMTEIINGMKVLKLYAWENSMQKMLLNIRKKEITLLRKLAYLNAATALSWSCAPFLVAVLTFGMYVTIDPEHNILTPQITFVALSLFNILRFPLAVFAMIFSQAVQFAVSNKRLKVFLAEEEIDQLSSDNAALSDFAISVQNGSFSWESNDEPAITNINLDVLKGSLVAVVGKIGSGKSSLLSALLGEMHRISGNVTVRGRIAYVPQQAWIQNQSLKNNILFSRSYNEKLYNDVIEGCSLKVDLIRLPAGDATEIGEKGINLSGGQKQRIYLASNGMLKNKTRIFVTHGLNYLKHCDQIIVMKDGKINESGTYADLLSSSGDFSEILEEFLIEESKNRGRSVSFGEDVEEVREVMADLEKFYPEKRGKLESQLSRASENMDRDRLSPSSYTQIKSPKRRSVDYNEKLQKSNLASTTLNKPLNTDKAKLIEKEGVEIGQVKYQVYMSYLNAIGPAITLLFFLIYILSSMLGVISNLWLADWSDHAKEIQVNMSNNGETNRRLGIYTSLGLSQALLVCVASIIMALGMVRASRLLHENALINVLKSPMSFFDVTPVGRILNIFSKEIEALDTRIPSSILNFVGIIIQGFAIMGVTIIATPHIIYPLVPILFAYIYLMRFYVSTSRQLKRLESTSRSPIYSHFQESIQGASSIRAYQCIDRFILESQKKVDYNLQSYYPSIVANRWLAVRLEFIGNLIVLSAALLATLLRDNGNITAGLAGLSIAYALNITQTLNWAVRMSSELETNIVAVERIKEYTESKTEEKMQSHPVIKVPNNWPEKGIIQFNNLKVRYRADLDYVLKGINAVINSNEKIGIIGRTGAGKSSLALALFRLIDVEEGTVYIDDYDISKIGLYDLRSKLTIVPQDPLLFSGTLRMNLDPYEQYDDSIIWDVLRLTHMYSFIESLPEKLQHKISEGGDNLSVGQRQLICLARALLRKSKILILDEAAASVDMETDQLVQKTIREQFGNCTVLTIAHRLHSAVENDRLMVLEDGMIKEFDSPRKLLENPDSLFYSMFVDAGLL
uniref:ABC-type glutathione-S-conjugate transporter n=1 Tax=Acrobeloides nanus TaxID=290746 RepID=A0A914C5U5_9BILA